MRTINQTIGFDKDIIWIVRINMDGSYLYFSTATDKITLSGIDFDGKVLLKDSISSIEKSLDVTQGGTIGTVGNFSFAIARYNLYTGASNFFNDFYPATSKPLLTSKTVDFGICWVGATTLAEITWLPTSHYIEDYYYEDNAIHLTCIEYDELTATELPYYTIQNEFDNGISYYTSAPDESYGKPIPLVYGDFASLDLDYENYRIAPMIRVSKGNIWKASSHICHTIDASTSFIYQYEDKPETMMVLTSDSPSFTNTRAGHSINMAQRGAALIGMIKFIPRGYLGAPYNGTNLDYVIDKSIDTYGTITPGQTAAFQIGLDLTTNELGEFTGVNADCALVVKWDASGGNVDSQVKYYHPQMGSNSGYSSWVASQSSSGVDNTINYYFGQGNYDYGANPKKWENTTQWKEDELQVLHFDILNLGTSVGTMRIKHIYFLFGNLNIYQIKRKPTQMRLTHGRSLAVTQTKPEVFDSLSKDKIFAYTKGYMFDHWID